MRSRIVTSKRLGVEDLERLGIGQQQKGRRRPVSLINNQTYHGTNVQIYDCEYGHFSS